MKTLFLLVYAGKPHATSHPNLGNWFTNMNPTDQLLVSIIATLAIIIIILIFTLRSKNRKIKVGKIKENISQYWKHPDSAYDAWYSIAFLPSKTKKELTEHYCSMVSSFFINKINSDKGGNIITYLKALHRLYSVVPKKVAEQICQNVALETHQEVFKLLKESHAPTLGYDTLLEIYQKMTGATLITVNKYQWLYIFREYFNCLDVDDQDKARRYAEKVLEEKTAADTAGALETPVAEMLIDIYYREFISPEDQKAIGDKLMTIKTKTMENITDPLKHTKSVETLKIIDDSGIFTPKPIVEEKEEKLAV